MCRYTQSINIYTQVMYIHLQLIICFYEQECLTLYQQENKYPSKTYEDYGQVHQTGNAGHPANG